MCSRYCRVTPYSGQVALSEGPAVPVTVDGLTVTLSADLLESGGYAQSTTPFFAARRVDDPIAQGALLEDIEGTPVVAWSLGNFDHLVSPAAPWSATVDQPEGTVLTACTIDHTLHQSVQLGTVTVGAGGRVDGTTAPLSWLTALVLVAP